MLEKIEIFAKQNKTFMKNNSENIKALKEKENEMLKLLNIDKLDDDKIEKALENLSPDELDKYNKLKEDIENIQKILIKNVIKTYNDNKKTYNAVLSKLKQRKFNKTSKINKAKLQKLDNLLNNDSEIQSRIERLSEKLDI